MAIRVLFLTPGPIEAAGTRYRVLQYLPYLRSKEFECSVVPFLPSEEFLALYTNGGGIKKARGFLSASGNRLTQVLRAYSYDVVVVAREAMLFGPPIIEWLIRHISRTPIVFDFDDPVFVPYVSPTYGRVATLLKCAWKTVRIVKMSAHVIAGNRYLAQYALQYNSRVTVLPTVIDMDDCSNRKARRDNAPPVLGWIGSHSTAQYLSPIAPALQELARRHDFTLRVVGASRPIEIPGVRVETRPWRLDQEQEEFASLDIGLYPLADDPWARGKCAFKAIQYMAAGVPCVCSPVGMTGEVIKHGVNGFLASTGADWVAALDSLLLNPSLRERFVDEGRRTVAQRYSLNVHAPRLAEVLRSACA
jgi:glycosyltransferase involved in cell wall biosynthesis